MGRRKLKGECMEPKIDREFQAIGRKLTEEEDRLLEASLKKDGCIDPIVLWEGLVVDGHNRFRLCSKLCIEFKMHEVMLADRQAAREWIIDHQLGKRNLTDEEKAYYRGLRYREDKKQGERTDLTSGQNVHKSTAKQLAEKHGVDEKTIRRDAEFSESVDALEEVEPGIKGEILSGKSELTKKAVVEAAAVPSEERAAAIARAKAAVHVGYNTGMPEWYTPDVYLEAAREVLGAFDLDPASCDIAQKTVRAKKFFTAEDDGLAHTWKGRVWMNPPYTAGLVDAFMAKLIEHIGEGQIASAIVLVNNATDTGWFQDAMGAASAVCFPRGRIKFLDPDGKPGAPLQGQAFLYFGDESPLFVDVFGKFGACCNVCA